MHHPTGPAPDASSARPNRPRGWPRLTRATLKHPIVSLPLACGVLFGVGLGMLHQHAAPPDFTLTLIRPGFTDPAPRVNGQPCHQDCSASLQGYEWALLRDLRRESACAQYSDAFRGGCALRVHAFTVNRR